MIMSTNYYQLKVTNCSNIDTSFAIFLGQPEKPADVYTLAWQCRYCTRGSSIKFSWQESFSAIWSQPAEHLSIGVVCDASPASVKSDLYNQNPPIKSPVNKISSSGISPFTSENNHVKLHYLSDYASYQFHYPDQDPSRNTLTISCDESVPSSIDSSEVISAGIGLAIAEKSCFVIHANPNIYTEWIFSPEYFLVWGSFQQGEIMDVNLIKEQAIKLNFHDQENSQSVILNSNNQLIYAE